MFKFLSRKQHTTCLYFADLLTNHETLVVFISSLIQVGMDGLLVVSYHGLTVVPVTKAKKEEKLKKKVTSLQEA